MSYSLEYSEKARKQIHKLPTDVQARIAATLERIRIRPRAFVKRLVDSPYYALRTGDYRIIVDLRDGKLLILVIAVGKRENVYKR